MRFLPAILRRGVLLRRARELLASGDARGALAVLADPLFVGDPDGLELARVAQAGIERSAASSRGAIQELLARLREERVQRGTAAPGRSSIPGVQDAREGPPAGAWTLFRLIVDDAGEHLAVVGEDVVVGHASSTTADLAFLAHVEREHARFVFTNDFHAGPTWRVVPIGGAEVAVDGRAAGGAGEVLRDGARVLLGRNLALRVHAVDCASSSIVLELEGGAECAGAARVLLFVPGADGRITIGARGSHDIRVPALDHEVTLEVVAAPAGSGPLRLAVACVGGLERGRRPASDSPTSLTVLVPPPTSERFTFGGRPRDRSPFEIVVAPLDEGRA